MAKTGLSENEISLKVTKLTDQSCESSLSQSVFSIFLGAYPIPRGSHAEMKPLGPRESNGQALEDHPTTETGTASAPPALDPFPGGCRCPGDCRCPGGCRCRSLRCQEPRGSPASRAKFSRRDNYKVGAPNDGRVEFSRLVLLFVVDISS